MIEDISAFAAMNHPQPPVRGLVCGEEQAKDGITPLADLYYCPVDGGYYCGEHFRAHHLPQDQHLVLAALTIAMNGVGAVAEELSTRLAQRSLYLYSGRLDGAPPPSTVDLSPQLTELLGEAIHEIENLASSLEVRILAIRPDYFMEGATR